MLKLTSDQISKIASELTLEEVPNLSDEVVMALASQRLGHAGQYGFMLSSRYFKDERSFSEIMTALLNRLERVKIPQNVEYVEFKERFAMMSDAELVNTFNKGKNNPGWVSARGFFEVYLRDELIKRNVKLPK